MPFRSALASLLLFVLVGPPHAQTREYFVYVASEAADRITLLGFGPSGLRVARDFPTGVMPADIDGPHGLAVAPDRGSFFVSLAHGQPFGSVWKYSTATNEVVGRVTLGMFPATMQVSSSGEFLYVANFNLHGDPVRSSISVVHTESMLEIARIPTCRMPHGSRFNPQGTRHYSTCMMDDMLVEIDTATLKVSRHFRLAAGEERGGDGPPALAVVSHSATDHGAAATASTGCSPTWAQPSWDGTSIFVACNGRSDIVEIDSAAWAIKRRIAARAGVYNLAATRDGRLLATNRRDQSVSIIDLATGRETARIATPRKAVHGVVVTSDQAYAFVSAEGIGAETGTVTVIDLAANKAVTSIEIGPQAGGIDIWK
jgi:DNA-binding beta-propeller fold protein YncE